VISFVFRFVESISVFQTARPVYRRAISILKAHGPFLISSLLTSTVALWVVQRERFEEAQCELQIRFGQAAPLRLPASP